MITQIFISLEEIPNNFEHLIFYFILMGGLIGQFLYLGFEFIGKGKRMRSIKAQKTYFKGLGIFILGVAICQILYLFVAVDTLLFQNPNPFFKRDENYDFFNGIEVVHVFRSFWFFNEDKFVITFTILFATLPFLTHPLEKYILAKKRKVLTYISIATAPLILIMRFIESHIYLWTSMEVLPKELSSTGKDTPLYLFFSAFWMFIIFVLFTVILILMQLYLMMGAKAPEGSKLRKKSKLICFGLIFYVIAIVTTQNASKEILKMSCAEPIWHCATYFFGYSTPILLFITLILFKSGFSREF